MHDLIIAAKLRELVAELVKAVWAARYDRRDRITIQRVNRISSQYLIEILIAHAPSGVAVAVFLLAEDGEADAARLKAARDGAGDLLGAVVEGSHAADPEQYVRPLGELGHRRD